jgi:hypothetical protein
VAGVPLNRAGADAVLINRPAAMMARERLAKENGELRVAGENPGPGVVTLRAPSFWSIQFHEGFTVCSQRAARMRLPRMVSLMVWSDRRRLGVSLRSRSLFSAALPLRAQQ